MENKLNTKIIKLHEVIKRKENAMTSKRKEFVRKSNDAYRKLGRKI